MGLTIFSKPQATSSRVNKTGSKLGPMMQPYLLLALTLPGLSLECFFGTPNPGLFLFIGSSVSLTYTQEIMHKV